MKNPFFSIIIPTFNSSALLGRCLSSIINQSSTNWEILIIDGLSTDNTLEIARNFNDHRIRIYSSADKGIYDAMNKGIKLAGGEWLYFLGSDDSFYSNEVLLILTRILNVKNKVFYGNVKVVGDTSWAKDGDIYDGEFDLKKLLYTNICQQAIFYHKSIFREINHFNVNYIVCSDWDFNLRCWSKYKFKYIDEIFCLFHGGNTSSTIDDDAYRKDRWLNILNYFGYDMHLSEFDEYIHSVYPYLEKKVILKWYIILRRTTRKKLLK